MLVFVFWIWQVYAVTLCVNGPVGDAAYGMQRIKFGHKQECEFQFSNMDEL